MSFLIADPAPRNERPKREASPMRDERKSRSANSIASALALSVPALINPVDISAELLTKTPDPIVAEFDPSGGSIESSLRERTQATAAVQELVREYTEGRDKDAADPKYVEQLQIYVHSRSGLAMRVKGENSQVKEPYQGKIIDSTTPPNPGQPFDFYPRGEFKRKDGSVVTLDAAHVREFVSSLPRTSP